MPVLVLGNSFGTCEGSMVGFSLGRIYGLIISTIGEYLVVLSLGLPLGSPLESSNPGSELSDTLMGAPLGLWFGGHWL